MVAIPQLAIFTLEPPCAVEVAVEIVRFRGQSDGFIQFVLDPVDNSSGQQTRRNSTQDDEENRWLAPLRGGVLGDNRPSDEDEIGHSVAAATCESLERRKAQSTQPVD